MSDKRLKREAEAGTMEREDCMIKLTPTEPGSGISFDMEGKTRDVFREDMAEVIEFTLKEIGLDDVNVWINQRNPLNFTIKARIKAAAIKGGVDL